MVVYEGQVVKRSFICRIARFLDFGRGRGGCAACGVGGQINGAAAKLRVLDARSGSSPATFRVSDRQDTLGGHGRSWEIWAFWWGAGPGRLVGARAGTIYGALGNYCEESWYDTPFLR